MDLRGMYSQLKSFIDEADEKLDSLSDTESAGRRKIGNDLMAATEEVWTPVVSGAVQQLGSMDQETRAGVYLGIIREFKKAFDKEVSDFLDSQVETAPKSEPLISADESKELQTSRSEAYKQLKQVVELAVQFGEADENEWELPKVRRGSRGKRGKRALSFYTWSIDGEEVADESNSPAGVAKLLGFDKAGMFTQYLRDNGVNTSTPEDTFEVVYGEFTVSAVRDADAPETSEDDEVDEEVDDDE